MCPTLYEERKRLDIFHLRRGGVIVKGKRIISWYLENNSAADPPISPVKSDQSEEELILVPYGSARLRITEFPVIEKIQD